MEARGVTIAEGLAGFCDPAGTLIQGGCVAAFGHQEDFRRVGFQGVDQRVNFIEVRGLGDNEFELVVGVIHESAEGVRLKAELVVLDSPIRVVMGRGVGELGRDAHEVAGDSAEDRAGGLDRDVVVKTFEGGAEGDAFLKEHRFTAGEDGVGGGVSGDAGEDLIDRVIVAFGMPTRVGRVAPGATEVAA